MPCIAPYPDWSPCPAPVVTGVGGVDVSAQSLCLFHYEQRYGLSAVPAPAKADPATVLLLHGESLADEKGHPVSAVGDAQVSVAQSKYGGSSYLFDGTGDWLSVGASPDWNLGAGDFTIDFWVNFTNPSAPNQMFIGQFGTPPQLAWMVRLAAFFLQVYTSEDGTTYLGSQIAWTPSAATWYHVAVVRSGNSLMMFVNGTQIGTTLTFARNIFPSSTPLTVGAGGGSPSYPFAGYLDEVRVSKGIARWTSNFTPPTAPYA